MKGWFLPAFLVSNLTETLSDLSGYWFFLNSRSLQTMVDRKLNEGFSPDSHLCY